MSNIHKLYVDGIGYIRIPIMYAQLIQEPYYANSTVCKCVPAVCAKENMS